MQRQSTVLACCSPVYGFFFRFSGRRKNLPWFQQQIEGSIMYTRYLLNTALCYRQCIVHSQFQCRTYHTIYQVYMPSIDQGNTLQTPAPRSLDKLPTSSHTKFSQQLTKTSHRPSLSFNYYSFLGQYCWPLPQTKHKLNRHHDKEKLHRNDPPVRKPVPVFSKERNPQECEPCEFENVYTHRTDHLSPPDYPNRPGPIDFSCNM